MAAKIRNSENMRKTEDRGYRRHSFASLALLMSLALIMVLNIVAPIVPFLPSFTSKVNADQTSQEVITDSYITADGETYNITVSYDRDAGIPADASLKVNEILPASSEYAGYLAKAESEINSNIPYMRFFDISILNGNGEEIQPAAAVSVEIALDDQVTATEGVDFTAVHIDGADIDVIPVEVDETLSFSAEGFSVYGVGYTYTVDFTYGDAEYHMPGGSEMLLSELLVQLGIGLSAANVVSVNYTDPSQLSFVQVDGDWTITSLKPFCTIEELTLTFADGTVIVIGVKDDQREADKLKVRMIVYGSDGTTPLSGVEVSLIGKNYSGNTNTYTIDTKTTDANGNVLFNLPWSTVNSRLGNIGLTNIANNGNTNNGTKFYCELTSTMITNGYSLIDRTFVGGEWTRNISTGDGAYIAPGGVYQNSGSQPYRGAYVEFTSRVNTPTPKTVTFDTSTIDNVGDLDFTGYTVNGTDRSITVAYNGTITDPASGVTPVKNTNDPNDQNTTFLGWTTTQGSNTLFDFNTPITENITIYPVWGLPVQGTIYINVNLWDHYAYTLNPFPTDYHPNINQHIDVTHAAQTNTPVLGLAFEIVIYPQGSPSQRISLGTYECASNSNTMTVALNAAQLNLLQNNYVIDIDPVIDDYATYYDSTLNQWIQTTFDWDWVTGTLSGGHTHAGPGNSGLTGVRVIPNNTTGNPNNIVNIGQGTNDNDVAWVESNSQLQTIKTQGFSYTWNLWVTPAVDVIFDEDGGTPHNATQHFDPVNSLPGYVAEHMVNWSVVTEPTRNADEFFVDWYEAFIDADGNIVSIADTPFDRNTIISHTTILKARYTDKLYRVHWMDEDGNPELEMDTCRKEDYPVYNGATPTKDPGDGYEYTFVGWSVYDVSETGHNTTYHSPNYYIDYLHTGDFPQIKDENWVHHTVNTQYDDVYYYAVFTKAPKTVSTTLVKVDAAGNPISGIAFVLLKNGTTQELTTTTDSDGVIDLGSLEYKNTDTPNTYYILREVTNTSSAPYNTIGDIRIDIAQDGTMSISGGVNGTVVKSGDADTGYTLTVTNYPKQVDVQVKKVDENGNLLPGASFTLTDNGTLTDSNSDGLFDVISLGYGTYTLTETGAPTNYVVAGVAGTITVAADGTVSFTSNIGDNATGALVEGTYVVTVKNYKGTVPVILEKVDEDGTTHMSGVKFELREGSATSGTAHTTGSDGTISLGNLTYGSTYTLIETADWTGSENYKLLGNMTISVSSTGVLTVTAANSNEQALITVNNTTHTITVKNVKKTVQVRIQKLDADTNQPITTSSATFTLNGSDWQTDITNNALTGLVTLTAGTYALSEGSAPVGYTAATNIPNVVVSFGQTSVTVTCGSYTVTNDNGVYTIKVTNAKTKVSVEVEKKWKDASGNDMATAQIPNVEIVVTLLANGDTTGQTVTLKSSNNWKATFSDLPEYDGLNQIQYSVSEGSFTGSNGYTVAYSSDYVVGGGTIIVTNSQIPTSVVVNKIWKGVNGSELTTIPAGAFASFKLYIDNGTSLTQVGDEVTVNGSTTTYTWNNLPKFDAQGNQITYTVQETNCYGGYEFDSMTGGSNSDGTFEYTINNKRISTTVKVEKVWHNASGNTMTAPANASVPFTLTASDTSVSSINGTLSESNGWKAEYTLPKYAEGTDTLIVYTAVETTVPTGYVVSYSPANGAAGADGKITIINTLSTVTIRFKKVDTDLNPLGGAEFTVVESTNNCVAGPLTSATDGILANSSNVSEFVVPYGGYIELMETKAPDGYLQMSANVTVSINSETGIIETNMGDAVLENGVYTISIVNTAGVELPSTGGIGSIPFTVAGIALMLASMCMLVFVNRKRKEA